MHLLDLKQNKSIYRSIYNHKSGIFDPPKEVFPKPIIIIEGLHAFYSEISKQNSLLKIYIDTDDDLKNHWKIIRDIHKRGYTYNEVLQVVEKRKNDTKLIRETQIYNADVIINLKSKNKIQNIGNENEEIEIIMKISNKTNLLPELFKFIQNYNLVFNDYMHLCKTLGNDINLIQDKGGNFSIKINDNLIIIKSSGVKLQDTNYNYGFSIVEYNKMLEYVTLNGFNMTETYLENIKSNNLNKPSMETGFHIILDKIVVHTHPIYLNILLCLENSSEIIKSLFNHFDYLYIKYKNPGVDLIKEIMVNHHKQKIIFLENHGLIVCGDNMLNLINLTKEINLIAKSYIENKLKDNFILFNEFLKTQIDDMNCFNYSLPDSVVFLSQKDKNLDILYVQKYIDMIGSFMGSIRYITSADIVLLNNLESEKYRKTL
jgi:ribulose-5-phosphate 4-epimerase/fuculose-1-phosphate aldolase